MKKFIFLFLFFCSLFSGFYVHAQLDIITTVAGNSTAGYTGDGGPATAATFNGVADVAIDRFGNIYIVDIAYACLRKVNTIGIVSTIAGTGYPGYSGDGGPASAAQLSGPNGVVTDGSGNIYIAEYGNSVIRKINSSGVISTFAGNGTRGYSGDGGAANVAKLNSPVGIVIDRSGNIYISDNLNNRIRKIDSSGIISTIAGNGTPGYSGDGSAATLAALNGPWGISCDTFGNVYVSDNNNSRVRKINNSRIISTIA